MRSRRLEITALAAAFAASVACGDGDTEPAASDATAATGQDAGDADATIGDADDDAPATSSEDDADDSPPDTDTQDADDDAGESGNPGGEACATLNDEFDDPATLACWIDHDPSLYSRLDVGQTTPGLLTLEPTATDGWFADGDGPFLYKRVSGDFVVETHVVAVDRASPDAPPSQGFNSAGFVVRDPSSGPGQENWLMYNLGFQDSRVGTEGKTTTNSESMLTIIAGLHRGRLRVCRIGDDFMMLRWLDDERGWTLEHTFARPDLPETLQVGMIGNGYSAPPDLRAQFDYVRFGVAADPAACMAAL